MTLYPKLILDALATVRYPGTGKNLVEAEMVADNMRIDGMKVSFSLTFPTISLADGSVALHRGKRTSGVNV